MHRTLAFTLALAAWAPAMAGAEELCPGRSVSATPDGRMLGHIPYGQVAAAELVEAPPGFAIGPPCRVKREMAADLARLLSAANADPAVRGRLRAVSCFRTVGHQRAVFCGGIGPRHRDKDAADRARSVGPPGYSEHATGYAIDFGTRPSPGCADVSACFAGTTAGRWLVAHAAEYGFELSFPAGNAQGVTYEPWHWRWIGIGLDPENTGAATARAVFMRARQNFPASPSPAQLASGAASTITAAPPKIAVPPLNQ